MDQLRVAFPTSLKRLVEYCFFLNHYTFPGYSFLEACITQALGSCLHSDFSYSPVLSIMKTKIVIVVITNLKLRCLTIYRATLVHDWVLELGIRNLKPVALDAAESEEGHRIRDIQGLHQAGTTGGEEAAESAPIRPRPSAIIEPESPGAKKTPDLLSHGRIAHSIDVL